MRNLRTLWVLLIGLAASPAVAETLVIQTWSGVWENGARAVGDAFAKKYNVEVKYELQQNTRLGIAKLRAQKDSPTIDIAFSTNDALEQAASENLLVPIDVKAAPGLSALPSKFVHKNYLEVMNILFGLVYRKDLAPFELTKWSDLADPRLKGKIGVPTAQFAGGRWLIMASLANGGKLPINVVVTKELQLRGTFRFDEEFRLAVDLMGRGLINVKPLLSETLPFERASEAFELASDRSRAMKVQLAF